jgi:hypothetical protein
MGFMRYFVMRGLEMQLWLFRYALVDWFDIFCMARVTFGGNVVSLNRYRDLSHTPGVGHETVCIVRKGEKQIQILDGY